MVEQVEIKSILEKFSDVNYPDHKKIEEQLSVLDTLSEKLDHFSKIEEQHYKKFQKIKNKFTELESSLFFENEATILKSIFGAEKLITPLFIPEPIFDKCFKTLEHTAEYRYWFLQYMAEKRFNSYINSEKYNLRIELKLDEEFQNELDKILAIEKKAFRLQKKEKIDISNNTKNEKGFLWTGDHIDFVKNKKHEGNSVEVLRVLKGYYRIKPTTSIYDWASKEVDAYFTHILLKPHLESLIIKGVRKENNLPVKTLALIAYVNQEVKNIDRLIHQKDVIAYGRSLGVSGYNFKNTFIKISSSSGKSGFNKKHYEEALEFLDEKGKAHAINKWDSVFN